MGQGFIKKCKNCNKEYSFMSGIGMLDFGLLDKDYDYNLLSRCSDVDKEYITKVIDNPNEYELNGKYETKTYYCEKCKNIINELDYSILNLSTRDKFHSSHICKKCNSKLKEINDLEKCPNCGEKFDFESTMMVNWD